MACWGLQWFKGRVKSQRGLFVPLPVLPWFSSPFCLSHCNLTLHLVGHLSSITGSMARGSSQQGVINFHFPNSCILGSLNPTHIKELHSPLYWQQKEMPPSAALIISLISCKKAQYHQYFGLQFINCQGIFLILTQMLYI